MLQENPKELSGQANISPDLFVLISEFVVFLSPVQAHVSSTILNGSNATRIPFVVLLQPLLPSPIRNPWQPLTYPPFPRFCHFENVIEMELYSR